MLNGVEEPIPSPGNLQEVKIEKWERSMYLMTMECSILEVFWGFILRVKLQANFLKIEQFFAKNENVETSNLLAKLIFMKYRGRGNIISNNRN
ncbi:hypothetical protein CR513_36540, partial [Mucuna pruriens]